MSEFTSLSAVQLARLIATGEASSREIVAAHVRRIEAVNPLINALVFPLFEDAMRAADQADAERARGVTRAPLHGVPVTIKESFDVAGTPTTAGLPSRAAHRAEKDSPLVARLRAAGAIVLGKTNVPQMLMANESDNPLYGRTNNPHNLKRAPGGSSGGEGAIIAAHASPLGLGSDIGGSVRLPSNACGVYGIKPTSGRLTMAGHFDVFPGMEAVLAQPGPLARSVADLKLAMDIFAAPGLERSDPMIPPVAWPDSAAVSVRGLRIAVFDDNGLFHPAPAVRRAVREAANALRDAGAEVEAWRPPNVAEAFATYLGILFSGGPATVKRMLGSNPRWWVLNAFLFGGSPRLPLRLTAAGLELFGQKSAARVARAGGRRSAAEYWRLVERRTRYAAEFLGALDAGRYDAVLCPADGLPAVSHGASVFLAEAISYCALFNLLGMPAGVAPVTHIRLAEETERAPSRDIGERTAREVEIASAGLPVGVQAAARRWREDIVLAIMTELEARLGFDIQSPSTLPTGGGR
jgi:fatty acid amide hydrolase